MFFVIFAAFALWEGSEASVQFSTSPSPYLGAQMHLRAVKQGEVLRNVPQMAVLRGGGGDSKAVEELVKEGVLGSADELNANNEEGVNPLWLAAFAGDNERVKLLLKAGASPDCPAKMAETPLMAASAAGHTSTVEILVQAGADIEAKDSEGRVPVWAAAYWGHTSTVKALLALGAKVSVPNEGGETPLFMASENGHHHAVRILLESGARVEREDVEGRSPLWRASDHGHAQVVKVLLEAGADPNHKADVRHKKGVCPLAIAASSGHAEAVKALLGGGAEVDALDELHGSPLRRASGCAYEGREATIHTLLAANADPNLQDSIGRGALWVASSYGHMATVAMLLEAKAQVDLEDAEYKSPLMAAAEKGHTETVEMLLEAKANPNHTVQYTGETPLSQACKKVSQGGEKLKEEAAIKELLIKFGAKE
eukprot:CAMPEP_0181306366 /NCGR_PEP_ID=MMETSP1101-20121128/10258_1 /TAXON_ID=46948 /ORGANISM="Rhodomonas abbreviata, Strain Caron Lab Isolate" /LENGTH=425 /DNA_ID=CAMNT_0023412411 /DNA_START=186 /DNA_END=1463 /DNA_ORIENTATION=+